MRNLKFNRLHLLSDTQKVGNQFTLSEKLNLIKAKDNNVGKSTFVKFIFWAFGCEPDFDTTLTGLDARAIVDFSVEDKKYRVHRYKDMIDLVNLDEGTIEKYPKITGAYSEAINEILGFQALLPNRISEELESPPPAYYFSPFYVDQKRSWSKAWDNFNSLAQYQNWVRTVVDYHVGLLTPKHFELEKDIVENKSVVKSIKQHIEKLDTASEVISEYVPESNATIDDVQLLVLTDEIKKDLIDLSKTQEEILEKITLNEGDISYVDQQISISQSILLQLEADYKFAVENIHEDTFDCPLCGVEHENSAVNRASILTDKESAVQQLSELNDERQKLGKRKMKFENSLTEIREKIESINDKYVEIDEERKLSAPQIIEAIATSSIREKIQTTKDNKVVHEVRLENSNKELKKTQKSVLSKNQKETILSAFVETFVSYVETLGAESINMSKISKPSDHSKIVKEGGAAEGTRGILAYYLTIYSLISRYGNEVLAPMVVDTPNQHEQSLRNYDSIIELLTKKLPKDSQIILCAMENSQLESYESKAHIIELDSKKLMHKSMYEETRVEFDTFKR